MSSQPTATTTPTASHPLSLTQQYQTQSARILFQMGSRKAGELFTLVEQTPDSVTLAPIPGIALKNDDQRLKVTMVETPAKKELTMTYARGHGHQVVSGTAPFDWSHAEWWDELSWILCDQVTDESHAKMVGLFPLNVYSRMGDHIPWQ
jgi:hypothetical protein